MGNTYEIGSSGVVEPTFDLSSLDPNMKNIRKDIESGNLKQKAKEEKEKAEKELQEKKKQEQENAKKTSAAARSHYAGGEGGFKPNQSLETKEDIKEAQDTIKEQETDKKLEKEQKEMLKKQADENMQMVIAYALKNGIDLGKAEESDDPTFKALLNEALKTQKALGNDDFNISSYIEEQRVEEEKNLTPKEKAAKDTEEGRDPSKGVTEEQMEERYNETKANTEEVEPKVEEPTPAPVAPKAEEPKDNEPTDDELKKIMAENAPYKGHTPSFKNEEEANAFKANEEEKAKRYAEAKEMLEARKSEKSKDAKDLRVFLPDGTVLLPKKDKDGNWSEGDIKTPEGVNLVDDPSKGKVGDWYMDPETRHIKELTEEDINGKAPTTEGGEVDTEATTTETSEDGSNVITSNGVKENKAKIFKENQAKIADLKEQLNDPNLDPLEKAKIQEQINVMEEANNTFINSLSTEEGDVAGHAREREQWEKYVTKQRQKGLINGWIAEGKAYGQLIKEAEADLKQAKKSGDKVAIKNAEDRLAQVNQAKKDMNQEYGLFLVDALGASLSNVGKAIRGDDTDAKSLYKERVMKNLEAETNRWNEYRDQTIKAVSDDIDKRWGENSEMKQFYNSMLRDAATKRTARELGLLDSAYKVEATKKMSDALGTDIKETLKLMSLMGMGSEQMVWKTISDSNIDLNTLAETLADAANAGIEGADRGYKMINKWLGRE